MDRSKIIFGNEISVKHPIKLSGAPVYFRSTEGQEALDSFTIRSAEGSFEESSKGRIADGYLADFVVLGADPFETAPTDIHRIPVLASYLGGRCVYSAEA